ncbi:MAG: cation transporter [Leptolyngbyaceae cyanobacterium bins.302]|nr:cation transporter [Leptolyngbyaceae cyanobacterium bins.302]
MVSEATTEAQGRRWASHRILLVGLWLTLMMLAMKVWVGWATRSLSLASEALHTLVTSFSLLLSVLAVSVPYSAKRESWGHTRLESSLTLLLVGFLGAAYCFLVGIAVEQIGFLGGTTANTAEVYLNAAVLQLLAGATVISLGFSVMGHFQAQLLENAMLRFSFSQAFQDAGLMLLVLGGLIAIKLGVVWLDPVLAVLVFLAASFNVWRIVNWQLPSMMRQVAIAPEAIAKTARRVEGILHCYDIRTRGMVGRMVYVELRLIVHPECVTVAPAIVQRLERLIAQQYGPAKVVIQVDRDLPGTPNHREG